MISFRGPKHELFVITALRKPRRTHARLSNRQLCVLLDLGFGGAPG